MPELFIIDDDNELTPLTKAEYDSEALLQGMLGDHPQLLGGDQMGGGVPRQWLLVAREVPVPDDDGSGGRWSLDHLFLDQDAIPTFVEVKRASDNRIRREVVGQMLDYAANGLRYWPVEQIQAYLAGRVGDVDEAVTEAFGDAVDPAEYWQRLRDNMGEGKVRMLFVADKIPQELLAVVEFLNRQMDHSEVLAVEVPLFTGPGLRTMAPRVLGLTQEAEQRKHGYRGARQARPEFKALVDAYDRDAPVGLPTNGRAAGYRQVKVSGWPEVVHYEFVDRGGEPPRVGVEIHLESADYSTLCAHIEGLKQEVSTEFPETEYSDSWQKGCRLTVYIPMSEMDTAIQTMVRLIELTRDSIQRVLDQT